MDKDKVKEILEPEIDKLYRDAHGKKYAELSIKASINIICDRIAQAICQLDEQEAGLYDGNYHCSRCGKVFRIFKQVEFIEHQRKCRGTGKAST